jgi:TetR/AcrR family transcriptional regulator, transcriptional repressor for nem operon
MGRPSTSQDTAGRILDIAGQLLQTRGYNAFSYADIAQSLHITKASLHYHFPTKAELGKRLIERYKYAFLESLAEIDRSGAGVREKLKHYVGLYVDVLRDDRMCLCGMLAAECATLPKPMKTELKQFFDDNERWLVAVLEQGRSDKTLRFNGAPRDVARLLVGSLEGAMMLARSYDDVTRFQATADHLLTGIGIGN